MTHQRLDDGFSTLITFSTHSAVHLYEKEVTPPGVDGGGPNDVTTMHNVAWRTRSPKKLITLTEASGVYAYDPACYTDIVNMVNINQQITVHFPDGGTLTFWGWLNEFKPNAIKEGEQPTANCQFQPSNHDNASPPVEQAPTLTDS